MGHDEVHIGKCFLRIGRIRKSDFRRPLREQNLTGFRNLFLPLGIVIVEFYLANREPIAVFQEHQDNSWCEGTSAAGNNNR